MIKVELIYDQACPNVDRARKLLQRAFSAAGLPPQWQEWDRCDSAAPDYVRNHGSPTFLVNAKDVAAQAKAPGADCCRVYIDADGSLQGIPPVELITSALRNASHIVTTNQPGGKSHWYSSLAALPGIGAALLPLGAVGACPACWPAYAGLLSAVGLGFIFNQDYLLPLTIVLLIAAIAALGFRAKTHHGYRPAGLGLIASIIIIVGKFHLNSNPVLYAGVALLVAASAWNSWPRKRIDSASCPRCTPTTDTVTKQET